MAYQAVVLPVMIASPGDVTEERAIARSVIHAWNDVNAARSGIVLEPVGWDSHSSPELGARPQELINNRVLEDCDLLIGVFWTRIGTDSGEAISGTVEEIERHVAAGKPVMLYFSSTPAALETVDLEQYSAVQKFQKSCEKMGLVERYSDLVEFKEKLSKQIQLALVNNEYLIRVSESPRPKSPTFGDVFVSRGIKKYTENQGLQLNENDDAIRLLMAAASSDKGEIWILDYVGGRTIKAGKTEYGTEDARELARWESALDELLAGGFIRRSSTDARVSKLTHRGWTVAKK